jgi:KRAB domain-containing zinc finger protein
MYTCKFCNKELLGRRIYSHLRTHTQKKPFPCDGCQYSFPTADALAKHRRKHINKPFCCDLCTQAYETELMLDQHKKRKHEGAKYPYNCNLCDKYFHIKHSLEDHMAVDHSDKPNTYTCDTCGKSFNYKLRYLKHIRLHKAHMNVPRVCDICGKSFKTKTILDAHRKFTHPVESFKCPECGKILKNENTYRVHMNTHIGIHAKKTIPCTFCDKSFTNNRDMTTHVRRNHTGEQPFSCEQCQETFYSEKELKKHINAHIMAHECKVCHKTFGEYDQLARHFLIHTGEKPFTCKLCGKSFRLRPHVIKHVRIHDGAANRRNGSVVLTDGPDPGTTPPSKLYTYTKPKPIDDYVDIKEDL